MKRIALMLLVMLISGCFGIKRTSVDPSPVVPDVVESFEIVDLDGNGTIDKEEYYANSVSINTEQPTTGLAWIVLSVIVCTFGSAILYRRKGP